MTQKEHDEKANDLRISLVEAEKQIQDIRKKLDELDKVEIEPESRRWKPKYSERYWYLFGTGDVYCTSWCDTSEDSLRFAIGNVFNTKEEAEFEIERLKVIAELKEFAEPEDRKWDSCNCHFCIYCAPYISDDIKATYQVGSKYDTIYFESPERVEEAIKAVGEDRIKKYYLRVKE